jgi:hypothetical protein
MTLPVSTNISFNAINVELGRSATASLSVNDLHVRTLFNKTSGYVDLNSGLNKSVTAAGATVYGIAGTYTSGGGANYYGWSAQNGYGSKASGNQVLTAAGNSVYISEVYMVQVSSGSWSYGATAGTWPGSGTGYTGVWFDTITFTCNGESVTFFGGDLNSSAEWYGPGSYTYYGTQPSYMTPPLTFPVLSGLQTPGTLFTVTFNSGTGIGGSMSGGTRTVTNSVTGITFYNDGTATIGGNWAGYPVTGVGGNFEVFISSDNSAVWNATNSAGTVGLNPWNNWAPMTNGLRINASGATPGGYTNPVWVHWRRAGTVGYAGRFQLIMP